MSDHRDKYAGRFGNEENDKTEQNAGRSQKDKNEETAWNVGKVKSAWNGNTVYLPDELDSRLDDEYDRLNYICDFEILKDRHFKPLVVVFGLERIERMEAHEVREVLEELTGETVE